MPFAALAIPLFAFVAAFLLLGLSQTHSAQHGTSGIPSWLDLSISGVSVRDLIGLGKRASRALVSHFAAARLKEMTGWLRSMARLQKQTYAAQRAEAHATVTVVQAIEHAIPREAHKAAAPALRRAKVADRHATHALSVGRSNTRALGRYRERTDARLRRQAHAIDVTIPNDIAGLRRRTREIEDAQAKQDGVIADIEHGAADTWDWIKRHPLSSVTGLFAGAVVVALTRLGYGFLRCNSWRSLGRSLKCSDANILRDLLALATGILASQVSLSEFIRAAQAVENEAVDALHLFIRE